MNGVIKTNTVLDKFIENNRLILERLKRKKSLQQLEKETSTIKNRNYQLSRKILAKRKKREIALIAEIKKTSLSKRVLNPDVNVVRQAKVYEESGAAAISVVTQPLHFSGLLDDLKEVSKAVKIPTLRKEFIFDPYQIYETKLAGASAVLLMVMLLEKSLLRELLAMTFSIGLDALVEIHDEQEREKALSCDSKIIGVNARDLTTFKVDISTVERLLPQIPEEIIKVAESGIKSADEVKRVRDIGADAVLIGTAIMESKDPSKKIRELLDLHC